MSCPVTTNQPSFAVEQIKLNKLFIQYVNSDLPVDIFYTEIARQWYQYSIQLDDNSVLEVEGQCALLTDHDNSSIHPSCIRVVFISFDEKKLQQHLKKRYGKHYSSIPWMAVIEDKVLLHSLVLWLIQQYSDSTSQNEIESWAHIENALLELIIDNLDRRQVTRPEDYEIKRNWFSELEAWMDKNLNNTISLDDLASVAGVSVRSIQKAFRQYRQCTPMDALMQKRLDKAHQMLTTPTESMTVLDVAMELGYLHPSRFAKQYKKRFGENPSETLANARKNV